LLNEPYNLPWGSSVTVRATAITENGQGIPSEVNSYGARLNNVPPEIFTLSVTQDNDRIYIDWDPLAQDLTYTIFWKKDERGFMELYSTQDSDLGFDIFKNPAT
jgi:hypothetical protein